MPTADCACQGFPTGVGFSVRGADWKGGSISKPELPFIYGGEDSITYIGESGLKLWRKGDADLQIPAFQGQLGPLTPDAILEGM